jgi:hypothetical protein
MTVSIQAPGRVARLSAGVAGGSVREVRLVRLAERAWATGEVVSWSGRVYRVEATEAAPAGPCYLHLRPESDGS